MIEPDGLIAQVFAAALALTLRATALLAGSLLLALLLRRASGAARHALWSVTIPALLLLPFLTVVLPEVSLPLPLGRPESVVPMAWRTAGSAGADDAPARLAATAEPGRHDGATNLSLEGVGTPNTNSARGAGAPETSNGGGVRADAAIDLLGGVALLVWLAGFLATAGALCVGLARASRLARRAVPEDGDEWRTSVRRAAERAGVRRPVALRIGPDVPTPLAGGFVRPLILLPEDARLWPAERREIVLLHELFHIRRADVLRQLSARLALALYWFHPLAWAAARMATFAREQACDEAVIALGHRPSSYARHILAVAERASLPVPALSRFQRPQLEKRLMAILRTDTDHRLRRATLLATLPIAAWALVVSATMPVPRATVAGAGAPRPPEQETQAPSPPSSAVPLAPPGPLPAPDAMPQAARPALRFQQERDCRLDGMRAGLLGTSSSWNTNDERVMRVQLDDDLALCMHVRGDITFDDSGARILSLGDGAHLVLAARGERASQFLEIFGGPAGPEYAWFVDGSPRPFDEAAAEWRDAMLAVLGGRSEISRIRGEESSLRGAISSIRGRESSLRGEISSVRGHVSSLRGQISSVRGHESSLRGEISSVRGRVSSLRGEISSIRGHVSSLRGEISSSQGRMSSLESARRLTGDPETRERLAAEVEAAEAAVSAVEREIAAYDADARVAEIERQIAAYDADGQIAEIEARSRDWNTDEQVRRIEAELEAYDADARVREIEGRIDALDVAGQVRRVEEQIRDLDADRRVAEIEARLVTDEQRLRDVIGRMRE